MTSDARDGGAQEVRQLDGHPLDLDGEDWRRIREALRYLGRDLHHRSFAVPAGRRDLLWAEMDRCLALADRIARALPPGEGRAAPEPGGAGLSG